ncbi:MAG TPA: DUF6454 family protein [Kofleriaceae bacterium]|nr:DUF6454 family protein [Kofleriaceae bacterium]
MTRTRALALLSSLAGCVSPAEDAGRTGSAPAELSSRHHGRDSATTELFRLMGKNAIWTPVGAVEMQGWTTFHTQGMLRIGDDFFVSSVEVIEPTVRNGVETDALYDFSIDRSPGSGRGWLSRFAADGSLLGQVELTDGTIYHPGGIDFDGEHIWVPVAEYRPNSRSNVYRVDPDSLEAELVFSVDDHVGGVVHNRHGHRINGVSWGSRRLYTWKRDGRAESWVPNREATIDYQDCHYQGVEYMLCGGVGGYATPRGPIAFGGLDLVDLRSARQVHQVPVNLFVDEGSGPNPELALSHNAFWAEPANDESLRFYFMTETDNQAALLIYDATPWINRPGQDP